MDAMQQLAEIDHAMTEIDLGLYEWQTAMDMMSFIGQDIPMRVYEAEPAQMERMVVKRVPLIRHEEGERVVIGTVDLDEGLDVIRAEVNADQAEILSLPGAAYSIADEDPPKLNQKAIRAQLRSLISPDMYINQFENLSDVATIKVMVGGNWLDTGVLVNPESHNFFKE